MRAYSLLLPRSYCPKQPCRKGPGGRGDAYQSRVLTPAAIAAWSSRMACLLVVVRHGETVDNVNGIIQGQSHGKLTAQGEAQCQLLAKRLSTQRFHRVYCSDLQRTVDTLSCVSPSAFLTDPVYTPLLRERACGDLEGKPLSVLRPGSVSSRAWRPDNGGESWEDVRVRAHVFLDTTLREVSTTDERVLAITHGGFINELLAAAGVRSSAGRAGNTAVYELSLRRRKSGHPAAALIVDNDTSHLPQGLITAGRNA